MEALKIVGAGVVSAVIYGILHDLVTANLCVEYFSVFHPPVFNTHSPWLLALGWGFIATWWMGLFLGILIAAAARTGSLPKLSWRDLVAPLAAVMFFSYVAAFVAGITGYNWVVAIPEWALNRRVLDAHLSPAKQRFFTADLYAHNASYAVSAILAVLLCFWVIGRRVRLGRDATGGQIVF